MGLLDSVVGAFGQQGQPGQPGHQQAGGAAGLLGVVMLLLQASGGLSGLLQKFEASGLGDIAKSWISQGENQPVSGDQLHRVLEPDTVAQVSQHMGVPPADAMAQLSKYLPQVVDKLSPNGHVADDGQGGLGQLEGISGMLAGLFK